MRRVISILILCVLIISLVGCAVDEDPTDFSMSTSYNAAHIQSIYFDSEIVEEGDAYYIIRDLNTNVLYLVVGGYRSCAIIPIYDTDGTVRTYTEFCNQGG